MTTSEFRVARIDEGKEDLGFSIFPTIPYLMVYLIYLSNGEWFGVR